MGLAKEEVGTRNDWAVIESWLRADLKRIEQLSVQMADPLIEVIQWGLMQSKEVAQARPSVRNYWTDLVKYLQKQGELPNMMTHKAASFIEGNLQKGNLASSAAKQNVSTSDMGNVTKEESAKAAFPAAVFPQKQVRPSPSTATASASEVITLPEGFSPGHDANANTAVAADADSGHGNNDMNDQSQPKNTSQPASPQWRYLPVPDGPDKHDEFDSRSASSPEGLKIIGARARGKKHKHEGTNCDDWFEFIVDDPWTIIAVSDGAGSKTFSRIGAKYSCRAAIKRLNDDLKNHKLEARENWSSDTFKRDEISGIFAEADLEFVQESIHNAMWTAYGAVEAAAEDLANSAEHEHILGRKVTIEDLSGTLLLAVHTSVKYKGADYSFVLTCQIGDGMLAAIDHNGGLQLLGVPDSGEFAGQTDFLTNRKKLDRDNLWRKTFGFFRPLQALMVMTDGVADDYFPNDPGMLRLYGDLVISGVLEIKGPSDSDVALALSKTKLPTLDDVVKSELTSLVETTTADGPQQVPIRSVANYAEKLGIPLPEVVASPALLIAGSYGEQISDQSKAEDKLRVWLDSYQVRGSFDDRTLVALYREVVT
jgi:hypothetical protein